MTILPLWPGAHDPAIAAQSAAAATIARVLEQIDRVRPQHVAFEAAADGDILARVVIEQGVCEMLCRLNGDGDLISARLIEL